MARYPFVLLYSTTLHCWEVWTASRPVASGSLEILQDVYPQAGAPSPEQLKRAANDQERA